MSGFISLFGRTDSSQPAGHSARKLLQFQWHRLVCSRAMWPMVVRILYRVVVPVACAHWPLS